MNSAFNLKMSTFPELVSQLNPHNTDTTQINLKSSSCFNEDDSEKLLQDASPRSILLDEDLTIKETLVKNINHFEVDFSKILFPLFENVGNKTLANGQSKNKALDDLALKMHCASVGYKLHEPVKLSLQQMLTIGAACLGWKVHIDSTDGHYVGYICWMLEHCSRLGLAEVSKPDDGLKIPGLVLVYYRSIKSVTLLSKRMHRSANQKQANSLLNERKGRALLMKKMVRPHLVDFRKEEEEDAESSEEDVPPLPPPVEGLSRPCHWELVDSLGEAYDRAVTEITQCSSIGLSSYGFRLGRDGQLAWLCIATFSTVFLFDVATLGLYSTLHGKPIPKKAKFTSVSSKSAELSCQVTHPSCDIKSSDCVTKSDSSPQTSSRATIRNDFNGETDSGDSLPVIATKSCEPPQNEVVSQIPSDTKLSSSEPSLSKCSASQADKNFIYNLSESYESTAEKKCTMHCLLDVLLNPLLMKVMHDSRNLCDLLYHHCNVTINGLYDLQAAELYLYMLEHKGDCPAFVPPLGTLLIKYLNLSRSQLLFEKTELCGEDLSVFHERPLPAPVLSAIASSAVFLCEVERLQHNVLTADLRQLSSVHAMAYALKDDLTRNRIEHHVVPQTVQTLGRRTVLKSIPAR